MARDHHGLLFGRIVFIGVIFSACALLSSVVPERLSAQELARAEGVALNRHAKSVTFSLASGSDNICDRRIKNDSRVPFRVFKAS